MARVYNFSAGPAVLPEEVLKEAAEEMLLLILLQGALLVLQKNYKF